MGTRQQALNEGIYLDNRMVVEYVQRGRTGLPGARLEGQYDDQRARPRTNQADQPPEFGQLKQALIRYKQIAGDKAIKSIADAATLGDLFNAPQEAKRIHLNSRNPFHKAWDKAGEHGETIVSALELIPDENGLGVLRGGLQFVFNVAIQMKKRREQILTAFEDIPETLVRLMKHDYMYKIDPSYRACRDELYVAIPLAIAKCIEWLVDRTIWNKVLEEVFLRAMDDKIVDDLLRDVQTLRKRLADIMEDLRVRNEFQRSKDLLALRQQGNYTGAQNTQLLRRTDDLHKQGEEILVGISSTNDTLRNMISTWDVTMRRVAEREVREVAKDRIDNHTIKLLQDQVKQYRIESERLAFQYEIEKRSRLSLEQKLDTRRIEYQPKPMIHQNTFIDLMTMPGLSENAELAQLGRDTSSFGPDSLRTAHSVLQCPATRNWMIQPQGGVLFINGSPEDELPSRISPITVVLASFAVGLFDDHSSSVIFFFCSLHSWDSAGPAQLMRSLVKQLLVQHDFELTFVNTIEYREKLRRCDLPTLCDAFVQLTRQVLAHQDLFCLLDGICFYESNLWGEDLAMIVDCINQLTSEPAKGSFKVLMTSPWRSGQVIRQLQGVGAVHVVDMSYQPMVDERDMPTEREMMMVGQMEPSDYPNW